MDKEQDKKLQSHKDNHSSRHRDRHSRSRSRDRNRNRYNDRRSDNYNKKRRNRRSYSRSSSRDRYRYKRDQRMRNDNDRHSVFNMSESDFKNHANFSKKDKNPIDEDDFEFINHQLDKQNGKGEESKTEEKVEKEKPCFEPSGILAEFQNNVRGVVLKFTEPLDAAIPNEKWVLYPFKGDQVLDPIALNKKSVYLFGRDHRVSDVMLENPSCSMQHAVIQFREKVIQKILTAEEQAQQRAAQPFIIETVVKPYFMDLESTNKSFLNGDAIEPARYYELREKDVLKFGESQREYVVMKK